MSHPRRAAPLLALLALLAGCHTWPRLAQTHRSSPGPQPTEQLTEWTTTQPTPQDQTTDQLTARVQQFVSSVPPDSLATRVARSQAEPNPAPTTQPLLPDLPEPAKPQPQQPSQQAPAVEPSPYLSPPTVVALEVRPDTGLESLASRGAATDQPITDQPIGQTNRPLQTLAEPNRPDLEALIEDLRRDLATQPNQPDKQFALRLLYLLDGQDDQARAAIEGTNADLQQMLAALADTLIAARPTDPGAPGPADSADQALRAIDELRRLIRAHAALTVPTLALCRRVESFGVYEPIEPLSFPAGREQPVILYCELANFRTEPADPNTPALFKTLLTLRIQIYAAAGELIHAEPEQQITDLSRNLRSDFFLAKLLHLPASLAPGHYVLKVAITDLLAAKRAEARLTFTITPEQPAPASPAVPTASARLAGHPATAPAGR